MTAVPARVGPQAEAAGVHDDAMALEARINQVVRGAARAAVLGVNDGLVSNVCLILAVAGAEASRSAVRLAGFASLIAGALSMAAGEWISVRSQVELFEGILGRLRGLVRRDPELILDQLTDRLEAAGIARDTAQRASTELPLDEPRFLRFCANTLFGLKSTDSMHHDLFTLQRATRWQRLLKLQLPGALPAILSRLQLRC